MNANSAIGTRSLKLESLTKPNQTDHVAKQSLQYVEENFITLPELAKRAGVTTDYVLTLIRNEIIPAPSYTIKKHIEIKSPLNDTALIEEEVRYFPLSLVEKVKGLRNLELPVDDLKRLEREIFEVGMRDELDGNFYKKYAYMEAQNEEGSFEEDSLDLAIAREWRAYLDGIYGICTKEASVKQIVAKEIAVNRLKSVIQTEMADRLTAREEALKSIEAFNQVASEFAPYQIKNSSRGKYVNKLIEEFQLEDTTNSSSNVDL